MGAWKWKCDVKMLKNDGSLVEKLERSTKRCLHLYNCICGCDIPILDPSMYAEIAWKKSQKLEISSNIWMYSWFRIVVSIGDESIIFWVQKVKSNVILGPKPLKRSWLKSHTHHNIVSTLVTKAPQFRVILKKRKPLLWKNLCNRELMERNYTSIVKYLHMLSINEASILFFDIS